MLSSLPGYDSAQHIVSWWSSSFDSMMHRFSVLFHQQPEDTLSICEDHYVCAQISSLAYNHSDKRPAIYAIWWQLDDRLSNEWCAIYIHQQRRIAIIGYRGTVVTTINDILSDMQIILWVNSIDPRLTQSRELYDTVKAVYDTYDIWVCWHSLWGTLAYLVAKHRLPAQCVVFNPGSAPNGVFVQLLSDTLRREPWTQVTTTYKILWDIVSTCSYVWDTHLLTKALSDPLQLHSMSHFI